MAISPEQPGWSRWPQPQANPDYVVVDPNMMPYESQPVTSGPLQRPIMATEFFHNMPYRAPMTNMPGPQYSPQMPFSSYTFSTTSPVSPFKHQYPDRPVPRIMPLGSSQSRESSYSHESRSSSIDGSRSPSVKSEATSFTSAQTESTSAVSQPSNLKKNPTNSSRTIVPIIPVSGAAEATFHTPIDNLMREIQAKRQANPKHEDENDDVPMEPAAEVKEPRTPPKKASTSSAMRQGRRVYKCTVPGCLRVCKQKTHLQIHIRSHTGEKPYICSFVHCGKSFSQAGNLKTHYRRHTKERPFKCDTCSKRFPQRGNLRSHMETHLRTVSFVCKLDNCNKPFTARGNLKTHQNNFHKQSILNFHNKLRGVDIEKITKEDLDMLQYLEDIHKNSNKGIKGRGRDSKVMPVLEAPPPSNSSMPLHHSHAISQPAQPHHPVPHSMAHPTTYMSHASMMVTAGPRGPHAYDMYDLKPENVTSAPPMPPPAPMYDDHQPRSLAFGDRMF